MQHAPQQSIGLASSASDDTKESLSVIYIDTAMNKGLCCRPGQGREPLMGPTIRDLIIVSCHAACDIFSVDHIALYLIKFSVRELLCHFTEKCHGNKWKGYVNLLLKKEKRKIDLRSKQITKNIPVVIYYVSLTVLDSKSVAPDEMGFGVHL